MRKEVQVKNVPQLATLCYVRSEGKTLMVLRDKKEGDIHFGKWNGLGGKIESGESPRDCVIREVFEESGIKLENPILIGILTFPNFTLGMDWYVFVFYSFIKIEELGDCDEGSLHLVRDEDLLDLNLWEGDRLFLPLVLKKNFFTGKLQYEFGKLTNSNIVVSG